MKTIDLKHGNSGLWMTAIAYCNTTISITLRSRCNNFELTNQKISISGIPFYILLILLQIPHLAKLTLKGAVTII